MLILVQLYSNGLCKHGVVKKQQLYFTSYAVYVLIYIWINIIGNPSHCKFILANNWSLHCTVYPCAFTAEQN